MAFKISSVTRRLQSGFAGACTRMVREGGCIRKIMEALRLVQPEAEQGMLTAYVELRSGCHLYKRHECPKTKSKVHCTIQIRIHESDLAAFCTMLTCCTYSPSCSRGCTECSTCLGCNTLSLHVYLRDSCGRQYPAAYDFITAKWGYVMARR